MQDDFDDIPDSLRQALNRQYPTPSIPAATDQRLLAGARTHLSTRRPPRLVRFFGSVAVAAAAVTIVGVSIHVAQRERAPAGQPVAGITDLNRDGAFNILDALTAARAGAPARDVDRLAQAVVRVEGVQ